MLKLNEGKVFFNDTEIAISSLDYNGEVFTVSLPSGVIMCTPVDAMTDDEREVLVAFITYREINPPPVTDPVQALEPVDEEKAAMAEAIIDLSTRVDQLDAEIAALKGGV